MKKKDVSVWNLISTYKQKSIFLKYFLLIFIIIVLPLSAISSVIYYFYGTSAEKDLVYAYERSLFKIRDTVDMVLADIDRTIIKLSADKDLGAFLAIDMSDLRSYENMVSINNTSRLLINSLTENLDSIYLYSILNNRVISSVEGAYLSMADFEDNEWIKGFKNEGYMNKLYYRQALIGANKTKSFLTCVYALPQTGAEYLGAAAINIDLTKFEQFLGDVFENDVENNMENVYILDQNNRIIFNKNTVLTGQTIQQIPALSGFEPGQDISAVISYKKDKILVSIVNSNKSEYRYMTVVSIGKVEKTRYLRSIILYSALSGIFLSFILAFLISLSVYKPFGDIITIINHPEQIASLSSRLPRKGYNELKFILSRLIDFNINRKNMELSLADYLTMLKKAQSIALQSQINPHFLYNTLGTIKWKAIDLTNGENEVSRMITNLANLLRLSLETQDHLIMLKHEVRHTGEYVAIEKVRFEDMFEVRWEIPEELMELMVLKIMLQPVLENALIHGIKKKGSGCVHVKGFLYEESLVLEVEDDGIGMDEEAVRSINRDLTSNYIKEDHNIGLKNVNQRIKLIFGEEYGVTVYSKAGIGTKVRIVIPKIE